MNTPAQGISLSGLRDAFFGSEDILRQMLTLFAVQAVERLAQLDAHLAAGDVAQARVALHSLVNICGAVRAFGMSDRAKAVGVALKDGRLDAAREEGRELLREGELVLRQARMLLAASAADPAGLWSVSLPMA
jgi:HPt (histidine-containing phosphotransfer) domain-containing protein